MSTLSKQLRVKDIVRAFPELNFECGKSLSWNPTTASISYPDIDNTDVVYGLIHEIAHAKLGHDSFIHDIELLKMERDAWNQASEIAESKFGLKINVDYIEDCLDSYRDWLYKRSLCPQCHLSGFQVNNHEYSCPHCQIDWKVPISRLCVVKRKILP
ncbi:MAG: hypothetical protein AAB624_00650 [Patescibacteria group bacterium]